MVNAKELSKAIRLKKKNLLKPDLDDAGQEAEQPTTVDEIEQNLRVGQTMEDAGVEGYDHAPASAEEMGENESSQDVAKLKKISARIARYLDSL